MAGVLFVACIPTKEYERELNPSLNGEKKSKNKRNVTIAQKNDFDTSHDAEQVSLLADSVDSSDSDETMSLSQEQCSIITEKSKICITPKKGCLDQSKESSQSKNDESGGKDKRKVSRLEILPDTSMEEVSCPHTHTQNVIPE